MNLNSTGFKMFKHKKDHKKIVHILNYEFKDETLLLQALTRRSALNERLQSSKIRDFQRLEFIGDKVLNLVISDIIFDNYPDWNEGELTIEVSKFTNNKGPLAEIARSLELGRFLIMGAGEEKNNARDNVKVLSDALEALIGALWIDSENDYKFIKKFITEQFKLLGLIDFNETYRQGVIKNFARSFAAELAEVIMPFHGSESGYCELGSGGGMGIRELIEFNQAKARATKPLSGLAAALEEIEQSKYSSEDSEDDSVKNEFFRP